MTINDARTRGLVYQAVLFAALAALLLFAWRNAVANMAARGIPMGFGFWDQTAGFDINQSLIPYSALSTYGRAFWVGLINTLLVGALSIALATPLGFRRRRRAAVAELAAVAAGAGLCRADAQHAAAAAIVVLVQRGAEDAARPRQSLSLAGVAFLNNRGLYLPRAGIRRRRAGRRRGAASPASRRRSARGARATAPGADRADSPVGWVAALAIVAPPIARLFRCRPADRLQLRGAYGFNLRGGLQIYPEFVALVFGLVTYTAGFIAEIVRAGVVAVSRGQSEAAAALGLPRGRALRLVVVPQALRLIMPPLTCQYLNIVKNSSLAVFIGYPDLGARLRRHGAQPDPCGDAGDGGDDGGLSRHLAGRLVRAQPLQRAQRAEGALSMASPTSALDAEPDLPPPLLSRGALGLARAPICSRRPSTRR